MEALGLCANDGVFFAAGKELQAAKLAGAARTREGEVLGLIEQDVFKFCWIVDFPMYEYDEANKKVDFSHNPFSMPQGEMEALETIDRTCVVEGKSSAVRGALGGRRVITKTKKKKKP